MAESLKGKFPKKINKFVKILLIIIAISMGIALVFLARIGLSAYKEDLSIYFLIKKLLIKKI